MGQTANNQEAAKEKEYTLESETLSFKGKDLKKGQKFKATEAQIKVLKNHGIEVK